MVVIICCRLYIQFWVPWLCTCMVIGEHLETEIHPRKAPPPGRSPLLAPHMGSSGWLLARVTLLGHAPPFTALRMLLHLNYLGETTNDLQGIANYSTTAGWSVLEWGIAMKLQGLASCWSWVLWQDILCKRVGATLRTLYVLGLKTHLAQLIH